MESTSKHLEKSSLNATEPQIMWSESTFDSDAYDMGQNACRQFDNDNSKCRNPFKCETNKWYSWNKGWNSVMPGEENFVN
jgi:hypothetical protein